MPDITRYPRGLLDLLGLQSQGQNPNALGSTVAPTLELGALYGLSAQNTGQIVSIIAAPANGSNAGAGLIVPQGEVWRVEYGGVFFITDAGDSADFAPIINTAAAAIPIGSTMSIGASSTRLNAATQCPFWLTSGSELSVYISSLVGVPTAVSVAYQLTKLRA